MTDFFRRLPPIICQELFDHRRICWNGWATANLNIGPISFGEDAIARHAPYNRLALIAAYHCRIDGAEVPESQQALKLHLRTAIPVKHHGRHPGFLKQIQNGSLGSTGMDRHELGRLPNAL